MTKLEEFDKFTFLDKDTEFHGSIKTNSLVLAGSLEGDVQASEGIHLKRGSRFIGDIKAKKISFDEGSVYNGKLNIGPNNNGR